MNPRQFNLKSIRPETPVANINDGMSSDERFQNLIIRPIVQLQGDLFIIVFKNYIKKHKNVFHDLSIEKRLVYIENTIQKDMKFRNSLKGMIIGLFTVEEYKIYIKNSSALNKRMMHLVKEHLLNNVQLFSNPEFLAAI